VDNFNLICKSLPTVTILDDTRENLIKESLSKFCKIGVFINAFKKAQDSHFLSGRNEKW